MRKSAATSFRAPREPRASRPPAVGRAAAEAGAEAFGPITQHDFLNAIGIVTRARMLSRDADPIEAKKIEEAAERLVGSDAMGTLFKVLAIAPPGTIPAGFSAED